VGRAATGTGKGNSVIRIFAACIVIALSLAPARPAAAYSLRYLEPGERTQMLSACRRLHGEDQALCRQVVDDGQLIANYKRSCLWAMTALMQGSAWAKVRSLPATLTCTSGLRRAGYPVNAVLRRLGD
jgi:hypothetical protein